MQPTLPLIPEDASPVNEKVSVIREKKLVVYYVGMYPVYSHPENDHACFRLTIAQLITSGICKNSEIISVFGVTKNCVCRAVKQLRKRGVKSFFQKRNTRKGGTKLTATKCQKAQLMLDRGVPRYDIADELDIKHDTFRKAINDGRLKASRETAESSAAVLPGSWVKYWGLTGFRRPAA